jgi:hypothetical protein
MAGLASTSTVVPEWANPPEPEKPEDKKAAIRKKQIEKKRKKKRDLNFDVEHLDRQQRWANDRGPHLAVYFTVQAFIAEYSSFIGPDAGIGFSARFNKSWLIQGRVIVGAGFLLEESERVAVVTWAGDLSLRVGPNRFYFGVGPFVRGWTYFVDDHPIEYGAGGMLEFGWWFGDDRQFELGLRIGAGAHRDDSAEGPRPFGATSLGIGWIF